MTIAGYATGTTEVPLHDSAVVHCYSIGCMTQHKVDLWNQILKESLCVHITAVACFLRLDLQLTEL